MKTQDPKAVSAALELLKNALHQCEAVGVSVIGEIDAETPEGCFLMVLHENGLLWSGKEHGGQNYLNGAAAELALREWEWQQ